MSVKKMRKAILAALLAILITTIPAFATSSGTTANASPCPEGFDASSVDIAARRGEYLRLDKVADCTAVAPAAITIPVTGPSADRSRYEAFKLEQAEMMSGEQELALSPAERYSDVSPYTDESLMTLKERQMVDKIRSK